MQLAILQQKIILLLGFPLDENMVCGVGACLTCVIKKLKKQMDGNGPDAVKMVPSLNQERCFGMSNPNVEINIGSMSMKNPVTVASGTFGYGPEYADLVDISKLGAITVKGISPEEHIGNATPRTYETSNGMLNAIGLRSRSKRFCRKIYSFS